VTWTADTWGTYGDLSNESARMEDIVELEALTSWGDEVGAPPQRPSAATQLLDMGQGWA